MDVRRYHRVSKLSEENREERTRWAQSRTLPAGDVFRARLILALADDKSWSQIQVELHTSRPTIARWKRRFEELGMAGLDPRHKGSTPRAGTPAAQARVLRKSTQRLEDGSMHGSCRKRAATAHRDRTAQRGTSFHSACLPLPTHSCGRTAWRPPPWHKCRYRSAGRCAGWRRRQSEASEL